MAEKNILMQKKNADGTFDVYYPKTKVENLIGGASGILNAIKTVDGPGSGLDADAWAGFKWVKAGADITFWTLSSANTIGNNVKKVIRLGIIVPRPGTYRLSGTMSIAATINVKLVTHWTRGDAIFTDLAPAFECGAGASFTINTTIPITRGRCLLFEIWADGSGELTNFALRASEGVPAFNQNQIMGVYEYYN
jgi:hypothetical protein